MKAELQKAFEEAAKLPDSEQEALGHWLLEEMASEKRWDELFSRSSDKLAALGKEAKGEGL